MHNYNSVKNKYQLHAVQTFIQREKDASTNVPDKWRATKEHDYYGRQSKHFLRHDYTAGNQNHPSHLEIMSRKQFWVNCILKVQKSRNAQRALNALRALHVYPILRMKSQKGETKNRSSKNRIKNIAGRLPENSRNSFVDLQSKKTVKKTEQKNSSFH